MHPWDCPQLSPALSSLASLLSMDHVAISFKVLKLVHFHCPNSTDSQSSLSLPFLLLPFTGEGWWRKSLDRVQVHHWTSLSSHPVVAGSLSLTLLSSFLCAPQALFQNFITLLKPPAQLPSASFSTENLNSSSQRRWARQTHLFPSILPALSFTSFSRLNPL